MSNFKIYWQNGTTTNYENQAIFNTLELGARCDEAFASGSIKLACDRATNIPPYTLANIKGVDCLIQSEVTRYQTVNGLYMHNVAITELTSILECFIVGSKAFTSVRAHGSTNDDYNKVQQLVTLMNDKYNIVLTFDHNTPYPTQENPNRIALNVLSGAENDYTFGAGTTLYGVLTEIFKRINGRPRVTSMQYVSGVMHITFEAYNLGNNTTFTLDSSRLTQDTYNQNQTDYCKYLETEAQNVTDRTHLHTDKDMSLITDIGVRYDFSGNDTLKLKTSAKIDYITSLKASGNLYRFTITRLAGQDFFGSRFNPTLTNNTWSYDATVLATPLHLYTFINEIPNAETKATFIQKLHDYCSMYFINYDDLINTVVTFQPFVTNTYTYVDGEGHTITDSLLCVVSDFMGTSTRPYVMTKLDLTSKVLEKTQYEAESTKIQPAYCYYTKGDNVIGGLYKIIDDSLWDNIFSHLTGSKQGPLLTEATTEWNSKPYTERRVAGLASFSNQNYYIGDVNDPENQIGNLGTLGPYYSYEEDTLNHFTGAMFDVTYAAIINPKMIDAKTDTPSNESSYKPFTRSYNISASLIDFDKLVPSMATVNDMLGKPERTIEYDITGLSSSNIPNLTNKIDNMYLLSYSIRYYSNHLIMTMNLFKSYSKVAEAIGVATQYRATNFATDEIIERPIYLTASLTSHDKSILDEKRDRLYFHFFFGNKEILTRAIMMRQDNKRILYCEAMDQYAWGAALNKYEYNDKDYITPEYVPYCDNNNEIEDFDLTVGYIDNLTKSQSEKLPSVSDVSFVNFGVFSLNDKVIYKDQREKLTFTIDIE